MNYDITGCKKIVEGIYQKSPTTYYILCSVSKLPCFCSKERLDDLTRKFGSLEGIAAGYISRDAKRLIKAKVPTHAVKNMDLDTLKEEATEVQKLRQARREERAKRREEKEQIYTNPNPIIYNPTPPVTVDMSKPEEVISLTKTMCLFPNRFLDDDRSCNRCSIKDSCVAPVKIILTDRQIRNRMF